MQIEVLGPGCPKCRKTEQVLREAAREVGAEVELTHVTDVAAISERGVLLTPGVIIDGEIVSEGRVPTAGQAREWLGK
ncbi:MAG: thioredoxin family protein [Bacillota bacterium]